MCVHDVLTATRNFADLALGLLRTSLRDATLGFLVIGFKEELLLKKRFTIRSSREWNEMTAIFPPAAATAFAASNPLSRFSSSLFVAILKA